MVLTTQQLKEKYSNYSNYLTKINREVKNNNLFPLVKGFYETDPNVDGIKLAQFIYGPSYISFDFALSFYGLIPEAVYNYTCATYNKNKSKIYKNKFGTYLYRDIPKSVFELGIIINTDEYYSYQIATKEKALCDKLYSISPVKSLKELKELLFNDLRIYEEEFEKLNKQDIFILAPLYHSTNLNLLVKLLKKGLNKCKQY